MADEEEARTREGVESYLYPTSQENYEDDTFDDYDDDDFEDDDEQVSSAAKPPAQPAAPPPVVPAALNTLNIPINPASKVTQQELVRLSILAENQRSKLAERDGEASGGSDHGSRPGSGSVSSRRPSVHYTERIRRDSSSDQLPERRSMALPSQETLKSDVDPVVKRKAAVARLARWKLITSVVKLQQVAYDDVFSLAPLTLLELSHVGRGNFFETEARGSQTNDDSCTVELQTEHVETRTVKAQCPEDMGVSREAVERASDASKRKTRALPGWSATGGTDQPLHGDGSSARRLNKFVTHVGPIVEALLHERVKKEGSMLDGATSTTSTSSSELSAGGFHLTASAAAGRRVTASAWSAAAGAASHGLLLTTLAPAHDTSLHAHGPAARGLALVWDLTRPSQPQYHLVSESSPTCCCWSPGQPFCAIAGMEEGGICVWDLREAAEHHHPTEEGVTWRRQTYSTEHNCDLDDIVGPVRALAVTKATASTEASPRFSFQLVSLDAWANVVVWLVTEMSTTAGADADFGMRIGGKVKMLRTNVVAAYGPVAPRPLVLPAARVGAERQLLLGTASRVRQTFHLAILPSAPNQFVVAGDQGMLLRGIRFGVTPVPRQYALSDPVLGARFQSRYLRTCVAVAPSPFFPTFFTAAYCPSTLALYTVDVGLALLTWLDFTRFDLIALHWSPVKPSLFFALDANSTLFAFDMLEGTPNAPLLAESFCGGTGAVATGMVVSMAAGAAAGSQGTAPSQHAFALTYSDGTVAVHRFHARCAPDGASDPSHGFFKRTKELLTSMHAEGGVPAPR